VQAFSKAEATVIDIAVQECCDIIHSIMAVGLEKHSLASGLDHALEDN